MRGFYSFLIVISLLLNGCSQANRPLSQKFSEERLLMGTIVRLDTCLDDGENIDEAYHRVWERLEDISWRMNVYDQKSDVALINTSPKQGVQIGADTYQVIRDALAFNQLTHQAFDITVWPLIELWREAKKKGAIPNQQAILNIKQAVGYDRLVLLDDNRVKRLNDKTQIDLGAIAKGYAIDEAARIFRDNQVTDFFIDAGGDIYAGGLNCHGQPWRVGIRDPRDKTSVIDVVEVSNKAVTTSGNYEQYHIIDGEQWSHIINPLTGYPQKEVLSATVIADSAQNADAMSTALSVLGSQEGIALINQLNQSYACLIFTKQSSGRLVRFKSTNFSLNESR